MFMTPNAVPPTIHHAKTNRRTSLMLRRSNEQILQQKWNDVIIDGSLGRVHEMIESLRLLAQQVITAKTREIEERTLETLTGLLPHTVRSILQTLSFYADEGRLVMPEFVITDLIEAAVSQFLPNHSAKVAQAIWNFKYHNVLESVDGYKLTRLERDYCIFATPRLIATLVLNLD